MIRYFLIAIVFLLPFTALSACDSSHSDPPGKGTIQVGAQSLSVDYLLTNEERMEGMVRRGRLRAGEGVLFVYPEPVHNLYWANRTLIEQALQVAFIGPDRRIQRIKRVSADREMPVEAGQTVQFLLVVPDGWFNNHQVTRKDRVEVPDQVIRAAQPVFTIADRKKVSVGDQHVQVEIARTSEQRKKGLMHRKVLPEHQGMLFVYRNADIRNFHMKNTLIPLDIAFIDPSGTIQEIKQMEPLNSATVSSSQPAMYVLEMRQGWFQAHGIGSGRKIDLSSIHSSADGSQTK